MDTVPLSSGPPYLGSIQTFYNILEEVETYHLNIDKLWYLYDFSQDGHISQLLYWNFDNKVHKNDGLEDYVVGLNVLQNGYTFCKKH